MDWLQKKRCSSYGPIMHQVEHEHGLLEADMIGPISNADSLSMVLFTPVELYISRKAMEVEELFRFRGQRVVPENCFCTLHTSCVHIPLSSTATERSHSGRILSLLIRTYLLHYNLSLTSPYESNINSFISFLDITKQS